MGSLFTGLKVEQFERITLNLKSTIGHIINLLILKQKSRTHTHSLKIFSCNTAKITQSITGIDFQLISDSLVDKKTAR